MALTGWMSMLLGMENSRRLIFALAAGAMQLACLSEKTKDCHRQMTASQQIVAKTDGASLSSLQSSILAVDQALAACVAAERESEVGELRKARKELSDHRGRLEQRPKKKAKKKLSAEELKALLKRGDPDCPLGQAYKHPESGKEIRCTGSLLIEMTRAEVTRHFERRGFRVTKEEPGHRLRVEYGAELYLIAFASSELGARAKCVTLFPVPGMSWQEAVARATGVRPDKLKERNGVLVTRRGELHLAVEESEQKLVARIGQCERTM